MSSNHSALLKRLNVLERSLRLKIEYDRIWPTLPSLPNYRRGFNPYVLAHALKYIEVLQDGHMTSWGAESHPYHEIAKAIRRRAARSYQNLDSSQNKKQGWLNDKLDLTQTASEFIDYLVKREKKNKGRFDDRQMRNKGPVAEGRGFTTKWSGEATQNKVFNGENTGGVLPLREKQAITEQQRLVHQALLKIEAWAEDWLSGQLGSDEDWTSFETCLDRPDL